MLSSLVRANREIINILLFFQLLRDKQGWKTLKSYHLYTVILWEIKNGNDNVEDWKGSLLFFRFIQVFNIFLIYFNSSFIFFSLPISISFNVFLRISQKLTNI